MQTAIVFVLSRNTMNGLLEFCPRKFSAKSACAVILQQNKYVITEFDSVECYGRRESQGGLRNFWNSPCFQKQLFFKWRRETEERLKPRITIYKLGF